MKFNGSDDTVLLINNYGGLSNLEMGALTEETLSQLGMTYTIFDIGRRSLIQHRNKMGY